MDIFKVRESTSIRATVSNLVNGSVVLREDTADGETEALRELLTEEVIIGAGEWKISEEKNLEKASMIFAYLISGQWKNQLSLEHIPDI